MSEILSGAGDMRAEAQWNISGGQQIGDGENCDNYTFATTWAI